MDQKGKRKSSSVLSFLVVAVIALLQLVGERGAFFLVVLVVMGFIGALIWGVYKAASTGRSDSDRNDRGPASRPLNDRYGSGGLPVRPVPRAAPAYRAAPPRPASLRPREEKAKRTEELKVLLEAGIIDRAEYLDRMAEL